MSARLGFRATAVAVLLAASSVVATAGPSSAAPPVAQDDHRWVYPGQLRLVDVLANDSDPDGDDLAVCRVQQAPQDADYWVGIEDGKVAVFTGEGNAGDITISYYACDFETLVPATLTISFREIRPVAVVKLDRPGRLRVTNDNPRAVRFLYGSFSQPRPDGRARVPAGASVTIRVHRHRIDWVAILARTVLAGVGHVRGIELPSGDAGLRTGAGLALGRAESRIWSAQD